MARMAGDSCEVKERNGVDVVLCEDGCIVIMLLVDEVATGIIYEVVAVALVFGVAAIIDTMSVSARKKGVVTIACMSMFVNINIKGGRHGAASVCITFLLSTTIALIVSAFQHPSHSVYWWVYNHMFGLVVTCDCPLPPLMMQVPRCCKALSMLCALASSILVVSTKSA